MFVLYLLLVGVMFSCIVLLKAYTKVPLNELKRRVRQGDNVAKLMYKVAAYEAGIQILLWTLLGISAGVLFVLLSNALADWLAALIIILILWLGFGWLPYTRVSIAGKKLGELAAPPLAWVLNKTYPLLRFISEKTGGYRVDVHTGIYEKEDINALLKRQQRQKDSRIEPAELAVIEGALKFGDMLVRDVMIPRRMATFVSADDAVGPMLMDELHKSGHSRFPVYEGKKDRIVGLLLLRDMIGLSEGGLVKNLMHKKIYYVHEEETLRQALQAFLKTHRHLLVVVNSFEEVVGIITMEDVLEQIIGQPIIDEFDQYDDLRSVAAKQAAKEHKSHDTIDTEPATEKPPEVVE